MSVVPQELVNYIASRLQEGYELQSIKTQLLTHGYDLNTVDAAVNYIYKRRAFGSSKFNTSRKQLLAISAAMMVFVLGATFFFPF